MRIHRRVPQRVWLWALPLVALAGCRGAKPAPPPPAPPVVTVTQPTSHAVQNYFHYNGHLDSMEKVSVVARVKGILTEVMFVEGDEVEQGKVLFRIDPREYLVNVKRSEADRLKATAELKKARSDEERVRKVERAVSEEELQQRVAARETAEAVVKQAEAAIEAANIQLGYTEIKSPISGQIGSVLVTRGNLVGQNEPTVLTTIASVDPLYVYFDIPEQDLIAYQQARRQKSLPSPTSQQLPLEIEVANETGYPHHGKIDFRENRVDTGTGTIRIRGRIPNPLVLPGNVRLLYPGLYARVRVPAGEPQPRLVIPEDALMTGQEGQFVYVVDENNAIQNRTVTVGSRVWRAASKDAGEQPWTLESAGAQKKTPIPSVVAIEKGLNSTDWVVINGLSKARPGANVQPDRMKMQGPQK